DVAGGQGHELADVAQELRHAAHQAGQVELVSIYAVYRRANAKAGGVGNATGGYRGAQDARTVEAFFAYGGAIVAGVGQAEVGRHDIARDIAWRGLSGDAAGRPA